MSEQMPLRIQGKKLTLCSRSPSPSRSGRRICLLRLASFGCSRSRAPPNVLCLSHVAKDVNAISQDALMQKIAFVGEGFGIVFLDLGSSLAGSLEAGIVDHLDI